MHNTMGPEWPDMGLGNGPLFMTPRLELYGGQCYPVSSERERADMRNPMDEGSMMRGATLNLRLMCAPLPLPLSQTPKWRLVRLKHHERQLG